MSTTLRPQALNLPPEQYQASRLAAIDRELDILDMAVEELAPAAAQLAGARTVSGQNIVILAVLFGWDSIITAVGPSMLQAGDASQATVMHYLATADDSAADQIQSWFFRIKNGLPLDQVYASVRMPNAAHVRSIDIARKHQGIQNTFEIIFEEDETGALMEDTTLLNEITWQQLLQYRVTKYGPPRVLGIRQVPGATPGTMETQYKLRWDQYPVRWAEWWCNEAEYMQGCVPPDRHFQTTPSPVPGAPANVVQWSGHPPNLAAEVSSEFFGSSWVEVAMPYLQNASDSATWPAVAIASLSPEPPTPATPEQIAASAQANGLGSMARGPAPAPAAAQ